MTDEAGAIIGSTTVAPGNAFTATVNLIDAETSPQTITVTQVPAITDPVTEPEITEVDLVVNLDLPVVPPVPAGPIVVDAPEDSATLDSRIVTFTGSAPVGSDLLFTIDDISGPVELNAAGEFDFDVPFPFVLGDEVTVTFEGTDALGVALEPVDVTVTLPAPLAAPVITAPATGSTVTGPTVTVRGTGPAGANVFFVLVNSQAQSASEEAGPVIGADGTFSFTSQLTPGTYFVD